MVYTAILKRVSRELSDDIDEWQAELAKKGVKLSKEDVSVIMSLSLQHNGGPKQINIIVKETHRPKVTHKIEPDILNMDIKDLLNKNVKLVIE
jgi:hypothetical protein